MSILALTLSRCSPKREILLNKEAKQNENN
jgi:hypothetical protein